MLLVSLAILIEDKGKEPLFYKQERVGENGETFELLKFRTLL